MEMTCANQPVVSPRERQRHSTRSSQHGPINSRRRWKSAQGNSRRSDPQARRDGVSPHQRRDQAAFGGRSSRAGRASVQNSSAFSTKNELLSGRSSVPSKTVAQRSPIKRTGAGTGAGSGASFRRQLGPSHGRMGTGVWVSAVFPDSIRCRANGL